VSVFGALEEGFELFGRRARQLLLVTAAVVVPVYLAGALLDPTGGWGDVSARWTASLVLQLLTVPIAYAAAIEVLGQVRSRGPTDTRRALAAGLRHGPAIVALQMIVLVVGFAGVLALIVPGLIVLVRWFLAYPPLVLEDRGIRESLRRSWDLTRGRFWPMLGLVVILVAILSPGAIAVPVLAALGLPDVLAAWIGTSAPTTATIPLSAAVQTAAYWHLSGQSAGEPDGPIPSWV
jgi:hypothetical protein